MHADCTSAGRWNSIGSSLIGITREKIEITIARISNGDLEDEDDEAQERMKAMRGEAGSE